MKPFQPAIPPHVAEVIRSLHPDLKQSIKAAVLAILSDSESGVPLRRELGRTAEVSCATLSNYLCHR